MCLKPNLPAHKKCGRFLPYLKWQIFRRHGYFCIGRKITSEIRFIQICYSVPLTQVIKDEEESRRVCIFSFQFLFILLFFLEGRSGGDRGLLNYKVKEGGRDKGNVFFYSFNINSLHSSEMSTNYIKTSKSTTSEPGKVKVGL